MIMLSPMHSLITVFLKAVINNGIKLVVAVTHENDRSLANCNLLAAAAEFGCLKL